MTDDDADLVLEDLRLIDVAALPLLVIVLWTFRVGRKVRALLDRVDDAGDVGFLLLLVCGSGLVLILIGIMVWTALQAFGPLGAAVALLASGAYIGWVIVDVDGAGRRPGRPPA